MRFPRRIRGFGLPGVVAAATCRPAAAQGLRRKLERCPRGLRLKWINLLVLTFAILVLGAYTYDSYRAAAVARLVANYHPAPAFAHLALSILGMVGFRVWFELAPTPKEQVRCLALWIRGGQVLHRIIGPFLWSTMIALNLGINVLQQDDPAGWCIAGVAAVFLQYEYRVARRGRLGRRVT